MQLTKKQEAGLRIAVARYKAHESWTCIAGYAGTGKSTLVRFIISALHLYSDQVAYVSLTGKAASVLRHKGCPNAMTAHKLLYYSRKDNRGRFIFSPRPNLDYPFLKLIVVDEISMLPKNIWELLLTHHIHVIALGDPFQIPPILANQDNHVLDHPHIFLDEIMRQAEESEIIRLSMDIRAGKFIPYQKGKEVMVLRQQEVLSGMLTWADQIICATNKKKNEINHLVRNLQGRGTFPEDGDKVIATVNRWDMLDLSGENALVNGTIGYLKNPYLTSTSIPFKKRIPDIPTIFCDLETEEDGFFPMVQVDKKFLLTGEKTLTEAQENTLYKDLETRDLIPLYLDYGNAITGHRAQGSEWDKVLVFEENFPFGGEEHARWLYTSCSRCSKKLILVKK